MVSYEVHYIQTACPPLYGCEFYWIITKSEMDSHMKDHKAQNEGDNMHCRNGDFAVIMQNSDDFKR